MPSTHYPVSLHKFETLTGNPKEIIAELKELVSFAVLKQAELIHDNFILAVELAQEQPELLKGSINRVGSKLGLTPTYSTKEKLKYKHLYNLSEMMRANLGSLVGSYVQRSHLFDIIAELPESEPKLIAQEYRNLTGKRVTQVQIQKLIQALNNTGTVDSLPTAPAKLPLWATDTHHCSLVQEGRTIRLTLKLASGPRTLLFTIPPHIPLDNIKFTRPTLRVGKKNRLIFDFTGEKKVAPALTDNLRGYLGVDAGILKTFTATAVTPDHYSQSWSDTKSIQSITSKIKVVQEKLHLNKRKSKQNKGRYETRYAIQELEATRLSQKVTRLKNYRAHLVANELVRIALDNNLGIALENLSWVPNSHWEQSLVQTKIMDEATRYSVPVKKVNPAYSSSTCSRCAGRNTRLVNRSLICDDCDTRSDRDENASQIVALRALHLKTLPAHYLTYSNYPHHRHMRGTLVTGNPIAALFVGSTTTHPVPSNLSITRT